MNKNILVFVVFIVMGLNNCFSQGKIILELKSNTNKQKILDLERHYSFITKDTMYFGEIINYTDSSLSILSWIETNSDTTFVVQQGKAKGDTITTRLYIPDTSSLAFSEITILKTNLTKQQNWVAPFVYIGVGAIVHIFIFPLYPAITRGADNWFSTWAKVEGILLGVSVPFIVLSAQHIKYDLVNKWSIKTI